MYVCGDCLCEGIVGCKNAAGLFRLLSVVCCLLFVCVCVQCDVVLDEGGRGLMVVYCMCE